MNATGNLDKFSEAAKNAQGAASGMGNAAGGFNDIGNAVGNASNGLNSFTTGLLTMNQVSEVISNIKAKFAELEAAIRQCVDAYKFQFEQELKLETVMKQRMNATEGEIQSIKDLASAQQQVGIYGDEMILKGAQELATFTSNKKAIETLVPAMNNLIAQQYGYNASAQSFQSAADMMGKVLSGQTGALSRMGYIFSEEEKQMLKTGNEMERAATLAKIITDNVGEMNEALRDNDFGAMQAMANDVGDVQEKLGKALLPLQKMIELTSGKIKMAFMEALTNALEFINSHPIVKALVGGAIVAALTAVGVIIVTSVIPGLIGVVAQLGIIQAMSGPIGWISLAIGAIVGGVTAINNLIPDVGEGEDELAEKSRIWAENITDIKTDLKTVNDIVNGKSNDVTMYNQEHVDAYRTQLHAVADDINDLLKYSESMKDIDWRNMNVSELASALRQSGEFLDYDIQMIRNLKMDYEEYQNKLDRTCAVIGTQNALLERQNRIQESINATNERGTSIAQSLADAYARTAAGKEAELRAELALWQKRKAEKYYTVAKAGNTSDQIFYDKVYYTKEELDQMDAVIASLQDSLKPKSYGSSASSTPKHYTDWKDVFKSVTGIDVDEVRIDDRMKKLWDESAGNYFDASGAKITDSYVALEQYVRALDETYAKSDRLNGLLDSGWSKSAEDVLEQERDKLSSLVSALDALYEGNEKIEIKDQKTLEAINGKKAALEASEALVRAAEDGSLRERYSQFSDKQYASAIANEKARVEQLKAELNALMEEAGYFTEESSSVKKLRAEIAEQTETVRAAEAKALQEKYEKEMESLLNENELIGLTEEELLVRDYINKGFDETQSKALALQAIENKRKQTVDTEAEDLAKRLQLIGLVGVALYKQQYIQQGLNDEEAQNLALLKRKVELEEKLANAKGMQEKGNAMVDVAVAGYEDNGKLDAGMYMGGKMLSAASGALSGTDMGNFIDGYQQGGAVGAVINMFVGSVFKIIKGFDNFDKVMNPVTEWLGKLAPLLKSVFDIVEVLEDIISAALDIVKPLMILVQAGTKIITDTLGKAVTFLNDWISGILDWMGLSELDAELEDEKADELARLKELNKQYQSLSSAIDEQNQYYLRQKERVNAQAYDSLLEARSVNDLILTKNGTFSTHPEDTIFAMKHPEDLARGGGTSVNVKVINERGSDTDVSVERGTLDNELVITISRKIAGDYARGANGWDDADRMRQGRLSGRGLRA